VDEAMDQRSELERALRGALEDMDAVLQRTGPYGEHVVLYRAVRLLLARSTTTLGECRRDTPYAPLRPVIGADGRFKWCCTHDPEHCAS